jgi:hypothetical protein
MAPLKEFLSPFMARLLIRLTQAVHRRLIGEMAT